MVSTLNPKPCTDVLHAKWSVVLRGKICRSIQAIGTCQAQESGSTGRSHAPGVCRVVAVLKSY